PVGIALALGLIHLINRRAFGWSIETTIPLDVLAQAVGLAVLAALLAGAYPAWRLARTPPAPALREEGPSMMRSRPGMRLLVGVLATVAALGTGLGLVIRLGGEPASPRSVGATLSVAEALAPGNPQGFEQALAPRTFAFPADHGPHRTFRTEWWYWTGNLRGPGG